MIIDATLDFMSTEWEFNNSHSDLRNVLQIGFRSSDELVTFNRLTFDWQLMWNDRIRHEASHPRNGIIYVCTDQPFIVADELEDIMPGETYTLNIHARNAGQDYHGSFVFVAEEEPVEIEDEDSVEPV